MNFPFNADVFKFFETIILQLLLFFNYIIIKESHPLFSYLFRFDVSVIPKINLSYQLYLPFYIYLGIYVLLVAFSKIIINDDKFGNSELRALSFCTSIPYLHLGFFERVSVFRAHNSVDPRPLRSKRESGCEYFKMVIDLNPLPLHL